MPAMPTFHDVLQARLSRRSVLTGGLAAAGLGWLGPVASATSPRVGFAGVPVSSADTLVVPRGYVAEVLYAWGDPISDGPAFKADASNSGDAIATRFEWDVFVLCGDPASADANRRGDIKGDVFASPDGLWVDGRGVLWIQTDVSTRLLNRGAHAGMGNNQMLAADPVTREVRRFLTGPNGGEITGATGPPDGRTLFVNIQHPGETPSERSNPAMPQAISAWPDGPNGGRPRSATVVIRRADGGPIGT
jgi:secreted PhoX family phosphatase